MDELPRKDWPTGPVVTFLTMVSMIAVVGWILLLALGFAGHGPFGS